MGIVNVTPDSFSDGGRFFDTQRAVDHALALIAEGADILDIGGESTRPNASPVSEEEELRRVLPVIEALSRSSSCKIPISIDTMKPRVARAAVGAGATIINDVAANAAGPEMWQVVRDTGAAYVIMHMQGTPQTMQDAPCYSDVVREVNGFFTERLSALRQFGVSDEQLVLDPGIGFGKTSEHNLELLAGVGQFSSQRRPVLIGASRKAFIGKLAGGATGDMRIPGSLACACASVERGARIIRTHDVGPTRQALQMTQAILAAKQK